MAHTKMKNLMWVLILLIKSTESANVQCNRRFYETVCKNVIFKNGDQVTDNHGQMSTLRFEDSQIENVYVGLFDSATSLKHVNLTDSKIKTITTGAFDKTPRLTVLSLSNNQLSTINNAFSGLKQLTTLYVCSNRLSKINKEAFSGLTALRYLDLSENPLSIVESNTFAELQKLENLFLHSNRSGSKLTLDKNAFSGLIKLDVLTLQGNGMTDSDLPIGVFKDLIRLHHLDISNNKISKITHGMFTGLFQIQTLKINDNKLATINEFAFASLVQLHTLEMSNNLIGVMNAPDLLGEVPRLRVFAFQGNHFINCKNLLFSMRTLRKRNVRLTEGSNFDEPNIDGIPCDDSNIDVDDTGRIHYLIPGPASSQSADTTAIEENLNNGTELLAKLLSEVSSQAGNFLNVLEKYYDSNIQIMNSLSALGNGSKQEKLLGEILNKISVTDPTSNEVNHLADVLVEKHDKHFEFEKTLLGQLHDSGHEAEKLLVEILHNLKQNGQFDEKEKVQAKNFAEEFSNVSNKHLTKLLDQINTQQKKLFHDLSKSLNRN